MFNSSWNNKMENLELTTGSGAMGNLCVAMCINPVKFLFLWTFLVENDSLSPILANLLKFESFGSLL